MLRGPQTLGELRTRTERLFTFDQLAEVEVALNELAAHQPPLATKLPRQPGTKEARYAHLLSGPVETTPPSATGTVAPAATPPPEADAGLSALKEEVASLRAEMTELRQQFAAFKKQFE
jgi:uncharacterized protein YceH (UPF0502 family)